ncbi:MAG: SPOR domain-containing protein [bacterium]|nr:SPOR domain-containing protein [bacterium]
MNRRSLNGRAAAAALCLLLAAPVAGQTPADAPPEDLIQWIEDGRLDEARARISQMEADRRNPEQTLFLRGLVTSNGDSAIVLFERLLMMYPKSRYADEAAYRLGQEKMARGLYRAALRPLNEVFRRNPDPALREKSLYAAGLCYINLNKPDSAKAAFQKIVDEGTAASDVWVSARARLADAGGPAVSTAPPVVTAPDTSAGKPRYAVQVGAFGSQSNALMRKSFFERAGYPVALRSKRKDGALLYLVWIGTFATLDEARQTGERIKAKYGSSYTLVSE